MTDLLKNKWTLTGKYVPGIPRRSNLTYPHLPLSLSLGMRTKIASVIGKNKKQKAAYPSHYLPHKGRA